jgi:hypothetical protein
MSQPAFVVSRQLVTPFVMLSSQASFRGIPASRRTSNRMMRYEVLHGESFDRMLEARPVLTQWIYECSTLRSHRGLGMKIPQALYQANRVGSA